MFYNKTKFLIYKAFSMKSIFERNQGSSRE